MRTQIASRLTRIERNTGTGSRRIVVVENQKSLEAARAFLQDRADVDMDRITFVITGVTRNGQTPKTGYARLAGPDIIGIAPPGPRPTASTK
jgi:hypothetical protein